MSKSNSDQVKSKLRDLNVRPKKERGQNFLTDASALDAILQFGGPTKEDKIVEIGPGLGALTNALVRFGPLTVIEIEEELCRGLSQKYPDIDIINEDVRKVDFSQIGAGLLVFGNLPYSFSTDIVFHLVDNSKSIKRAVLLLQKEFAERMAASPGGRDYGVLSISAQLWADITLGPVVPGTSFHPTAKVDSQVVQLAFLREPRIKISDIDHFKRTVKAAFFKRRKKVVNSIKTSSFFESDKIDSALSVAGIDPERRAETLSIQEFAKLAEHLK